MHIDTKASKLYEAFGITKERFDEINNRIIHSVINEETKPSTKSEALQLIFTQLDTEEERIVTALVIGRWDQWQFKELPDDIAGMINPIWNNIIHHPGTTSVIDLSNNN